eukprot:6745167-Prymnesium_polylepis.1
MQHRRLPTRTEVGFTSWDRLRAELRRRERKRQEVLVADSVDGRSNRPPVVAPLTVLCVARVRPAREHPDARVLSATVAMLQA